MNEEALHIKIKLEVLLTEREAMIAGNQQRLSLGQSLMYDEESFLNLSERISNLLKEWKITGGKV